jgi:hypothetical protein
MLAFGVLCCLFGAITVVTASVRDFSLRIPVMSWGFIVFILGAVFIFTGVFT